MRANKLADDYSSFTDLRFHLGYGNLYSKAAKDLDEPFTVVEDLTKELLGDLVRRRALKVTKECTALTEQSFSTQRRQRIWTSRTRSSRTYEGAAFRQFSRRHQAEGGEHPAKSNEEASNAADK
ncbi:hypothetical protein PC128_g1493 [Phytophthora cactorum]|nr:hypothetical protein PC128_g1493 [Phytophthora cactorum]KAG4063117.1 hypothetical protein PC123_g2069 [Phytophthora cactorum]